MTMTNSGPESAMYIKKPIPTPAIQYDGTVESAIACGLREDRPGSLMRRVIIDTLEGPLCVNPGDWILTGVRGEHWAVKPDIFAETYEPASAPLRGAVGDEWQPIETAPSDVTLLFWWRPIAPNPHAEAAVIGVVSSHEPGKWWNPQRAEYQDLWHVTHWRPLPLPPSTDGEGK
jgi:hypothetical protein